MHRVIRKISHYYTTLGVSGVLLFLYSKLTRTHPVFKKRLDGLEHPLYIRIGTTDVSVFRQVFLDRQYDFPLPHSPKTIIDAGANVGLSAVFFALRYPSARIVAIEPERSNVKLLRRNIAPYPQIIPLEAALWRANQEMPLVDVGDGNAGFQIREAASNQICKGHVTGLTVDTIMQQLGIDFVDVLKLDIEGAEKEVFEDCSRWIENVDVIMAELHDHITAGCYHSFSEATQFFDSESRRGETIMRKRHAART